MRCVSLTLILVLVLFLCSTISANQDFLDFISYQSLLILLILQVRYTGYRDRPLEERQIRFQNACREGHTEVVSTVDAVFCLYNSIQNIPMYEKVDSLLEFFISQNI